MHPPVLNIEPSMGAASEAGAVRLAVAGDRPAHLSVPATQKPREESVVIRRQAVLVIPRLSLTVPEDCFYEMNASPNQPACPPAISSNSFVMLLWRSLLYSSVKSSIRLSALSVAFFIETMRALCSLALALSKT